MAYRVGKTSKVNSGHGQRTQEERDVMNDHIRRAYGWNYTDGEIALYADCAAKTVARWREARGLPANYNALKGIGAHA